MSVLKTACRYGCDTTDIRIGYLYIHVGGSSKIQTLCHMTQVLLKLRFTAMERLSGY